MAITGDNERIEDVNLTAEMQTSYVEYALSVIHARALPDARDGLKPVQRRILYMMDRMGVTPEKGHIKSARVVGEVMGKLHPHGDSAIYDALVRLARPFALSVPLVDGHGNFGSLDDGPAASRYTEARLAAPALLMTQDIDEDVVDFVPNYDNQLQEPSVLPAAFPQLLVNGANGIAVGMATNMAPHNPGEAIAAARHLLTHPDADVDELMGYLPGPDLPGGGIIVGLDGVRDAYRTGRGSFVMRARATVQRVTARRQGIVITELPYMVGPEQVIQKIKDGAGAKKLTGISNVHDLTDRTNGLRLVIDVKTGFDPQVVLAQLYRHTPIETKFGVNSVALVDGRPETLGLRELLRVYLDHRVVVTRRRSEFRLRKSQDRLHLVEGLLVAILDIDEVIQVIRSSESTDEARTRLQTVFDLDQAQADYILELRLRRLTKFSQIELETERDELLERIAELQALLADEAKLIGLVDRELAAVAEQLAIPRRTVLTDETGPVTAAPADAEIPDGPARVFATADWRLLREEAPSETDDASAGEAGEAPSPADALAPAPRSRFDAIAAVVPTTVRGQVGVVTSAGRLLPVDVVALPSVSRSARLMKASVPVSGLVSLNRGEDVVGLLPLDGSIAAVGTATGVVKRFETPTSGRDEWQIISLRSHDAVIGAGVAPDVADVVFITDDAQLLRYPATEVRPQGLAAGGMKGINVGSGARAIFFGAIGAPDTATVVTAARELQSLAGAAPSSAKISPLSDFPSKGRGTRGVRAQRFLKGQDVLHAAWAGAGRPVAVDGEGKPVALPDALGPRDGSGQPTGMGLAAIGAANALLR